MVVVIDALNLQALRIAEGLDSARHADGSGQIFRAAQLVNGGVFHIPGHRYHTADHRDENYVALLEAHVGRRIAVQKHVVEIDLLDQLIAPPQLDPSQRADLADATRGDQGVGDVRNTTDRKESGVRTLRITNT